MKRFRSSIVKKILGVVLILGCVGLFFDGYIGIGESVHAQTQEDTTASTPTTKPAQSLSTMSLRQILNLVLKIIYIFLWPLLVVAGLSLDNTLVYASIFHMDAPLWKFWNMMKNFANFTLGFMVLFAIIKSILTNSGEGSIKDEKTPLGIIKKTLIAGVLIQASRFLMAALVDLSTIATYAVGGLPLSILKGSDSNITIITVNSTINLDKFDIISAGGQGFDVRYTLKYKNKKLNISPCRVERNSIVKTGDNNKVVRINENYVIGRVKGGSGYKNTENFKETTFEGFELCVLYGNTIVMRNEDELMEEIVAYNKTKNEQTTNSWEDPINYNTILRTFLKDTGWTDQTFVHTYAVNLGDSKTGSRAGITTGKNFLKDPDTTTVKLSELIDKSRGFVGPLVTIYSSLLNFAQLTDTEITSVGETSGIFLIKTGVALALFFPLLALAVVLIARIGLLRLFIVASPFIVLKESFSGFLKLGKLDDYLSVKGVMGIVFAPVVSVAALSLSLIFLTALLQGFNSSSSDSTRFEQAMGIEKIEPIGDNTDHDAFKIGGSSTVQFSKLPRGDVLDRFSWLLVNFFAIGLMWMIVFAAIRANELGKKIGGGIQSFGSNVFRTLPIVPIPGTDQRVGIGSMGKVLGEAPGKYIESMKAADTTRVRDWIEGEKPKIKQDDINSIFKKGATQESITQGIQKGLGIEESKMPTFISSNVAMIGAAVSKIEDKGERENVIKLTTTEGNLGDDWFKNYAKSELDKGSQGLKDKTDVQTKIKTPEAKKILDLYFDHGGTDYTVKAKDNITYIIKRDTSNPPDYTVTPAPATTTPPSTPPATK